MVVGPHPRSSEAGLEMLRAGGNAFDAVVAAGFTEGVVEPAHSGVAGYGGAAVCYLAGSRSVVCVDFNARAPAAALPDMFVGRETAQIHGPLAVAVPGIVGGLDTLHRKWGSLPLHAVLAPAIRAARGGWACNRLTHEALTKCFHLLRREFPATAAMVAPGGRAPELGERMENPELARTLEHLAGAGLRDFYEGETAGRIVSAVEGLGGILTGDDLAGYQPSVMPALAIEYRGVLLSTPPHCSGGVTSLQILKVMDGFDLDAVGCGTSQFFHLYCEALKACWRRRLTDLGDPEFGAAAPERHLDDALIDELRAETREGLTHPRAGERIAPDPASCTSHLCAADAHGNMVSLTQTHGGHLGSWVTVPGTGLVLGHGMARFEPRPGWPNSVAPGKRPLHNMTPMLATRDGRPAAVFGTPGGRTIVNSQAFFAICMYAGGMDMQSAIAAPRLHCEEAEPAKLEARAGPEMLEALRGLGHLVNEVERNGGPAHGIVAGEAQGELSGATDPRGDSAVAWG